MSRFDIHRLLQDYSSNSLKPGQVLYLDTPHIPNRTNKFLVLAADGEPPLLLYINSKVARLAQGNPDIHAAQIPLSPDDYDYLDHVSYIDASYIVTRYTREEILEQLRRDPHRVKGPLTLEHRSQVAAAVMQCRTVEPRYKKAIAEFITR